MYFVRHFDSMTLLTRAKNSPHTTISALVFLAAKAGGIIATAWFPAHKDQIRITVDAIEGLSASYGLYMAGDSSKTPTP